MRIGTNFLVSLISGLALLTACDGGRTFNANVVGIDQINIEGVKAFASLNATSAARAGVSGGAGETLLYAVDQQNNITLPDISCNFVFGDEITEKERQDIIDDMHAVIQTEAMYDFGPYVLIKYNFSYTSSIINTGGGKVELTAAVGFIYGAVRKSDGKAFTIANSPELNRLTYNLRYGLLIEHYLTDSNANTYIVFPQEIVILKEEANTITLSTLPTYGANVKVMTDDAGFVYLQDSNTISILNADGTTSPIEGNYWGACEFSNKLYAFANEDEALKVYTISNQERQLTAETSFEGIEGMYDAKYLGYFDGEAVFVGEKLLKYNFATNKLTAQEFNMNIRDYIKSYNTVFVNEYVYLVNTDGVKAELVKINILNGSKVVTPIDIPQGKAPNNYMFVGSLTSGYLRLIFNLNDDSTFTYNVFGEEDLPDFSGYVVHSVIPLQ